MEEEVGGFGFERDVADFVDDEQRVAAQAAELVVESAEQTKMQPAALRMYIQQ